MVLLFHRLFVSPVAVFTVFMYVLALSSMAAWIRLLSVEYLIVFRGRPLITWLSGLFQRIHTWMYLADVSCLHKSLCFTSSVRDVLRVSGRDRVRNQVMFSMKMVDMYTKVVQRGRRRGCKTRRQSLTVRP